MKRWLVITIVPIAALLGCSGSERGIEVSGTVTRTVTVTVTASATQPPTSTPPITANPNDGVDEGEPSPSSDEPTAAGPLTEEKKGQELGLVDFFNPTSNWSENRYDVGSAKQIKGIAADVNYCTSDQGASLEMRLANNFDRIEFKVGQGNSSTSSDQTMLVELTTNGRQADIIRVPFNKVEAIKMPVKNVNALEITVYEDEVDGSCEAAAFTAVLSDIRLS